MFGINSYFQCVFNWRFSWRIFWLGLALAGIVWISADRASLAAQTVAATPRPGVSPTPGVLPTPVYAPTPISPTPYPTPTPMPPVVSSMANSYAASNAFAPAANYLKSSAAFRQEIARLDISVRRAGRTLPITEVPRAQKDDVIKIRLLDEAVGGIKPDQSNWDWTLVVAFINPNRGYDQEKSVSEEIRFRKSGWYKEYAVTVPYDAQPVFFFYPKPNYRKKIAGLIDKNSDELRKLGEKTIELAGAYAQINSFLNELQYVLLQTQASRFGSFVTYPKQVAVRQPGSPVPVMVQPPPVYNYNALTEQTIERLARSFNINLPACWQTANGNINYANPLNASSVNQTVYGSVNLTLPGNQNSFGYAVGSDLIGRAQCVAKNVRLEDFDFSVGNLLKQGGIFAAVQLRDKYPQLAYWINLAAAAIDFIVKAFRKAPLRIVPTIFSAANYVPANTVSPASQPNASPAGNPVKLSLYAEAPPSEAGAVTAYPLVVHRWQAEPDAAQISLYPPELTEPCLHQGQIILKDVSLSGETPGDQFAKDFKLQINGAGSYRKEFPLRKNIGASGWELNLTREDVNSLPKGEAMYEAFLIGARGFSEIRSPKFILPAPVGGTYEIKAATRKEFTAGGKRVVTISNASGGCRCLQTVTYKPASGAPLVYEAVPAAGKNQFKVSADGKEVFFEIDATNLPIGGGVLELKNYGGETANLNLKLYPPPPEITDLKISAGDREGVLIGSRLEQIQSLETNGKKAKVLPNNDSSNGKPGNSNERTFIFEEASVRQASGKIALVLGLEDNRMLSVAKAFNAGPARPAFVAELGEIDAVYPAENVSPRPQFDLSTYPIIPVNAPELTVMLHSTLTDYDFKPENLAIEIRLEKTEKAVLNAAASIDLEVLDPSTVRARLAPGEELKKLLGGRRLQLRLKDRERGVSDWYTVRQTFVRLPRIESISCVVQLNGNCEITGAGLDYIGGISIDGGAIWQPEATTPQSSTKVDVINRRLIPRLAEKEALRIKLRDYPAPNGLTVTNYLYSK